MELTQQSLIDEFIMGHQKIDDHQYLPNDHFLPNSWNSTTPFDQNLDWHLPATTTSPSLLELISPSQLMINYPNSSFGEFQPFLDALASPGFGSCFYDNRDLPPTPIQEEYATTNVVVHDQARFLDGYYANNGFFDGGGEISISYKVESGPTTHHHSAPSDHVNIVDAGERKSKAKNKPHGQPSKNLMAERRRRKRLNDRLSMLRSIVPKISKMDRTSILGDTIDYVKELLDKIHKLQEEGMDENTNTINLAGNYLKELKPNEMQVRNPPKFDVERRDEDTRVGVCCTSKPGLLVSTLSTLDALGLDIQQCVISCFNDFSLQASCYEEGDQRVSSEDVKQALFRNAGYGGRCV